MIVRAGSFAAAAVSPAGTPSDGPAPVGTPSDGPAPAGTVRRWTGAVAEGWDIAGNANGGYLSPGRPGPVTVEVEVAKQGRMFATATATTATATVASSDRASSDRASSDRASSDRALLRVVGSFGSLEGGATVELVDIGPAPMPPPDACVPVVASDSFPPPFMGRIELRLHPEDAAFGAGTPSGRPLMRGWFRLRHGEPVDTVALLCALDAFPPTVFNADLPLAWTPTVEFTTHVRARPAPGCLRCRFATHYVTGGFLEEDGEIWDRAGRLVAQSRQLALLPRS